MPLTAVVPRDAVGASIHCFLRNNWQQKQVIYRSCRNTKWCLVPAEQRAEQARVLSKQSKFGPNLGADQNIGSSLLGVKGEPCSLGLEDVFWHLRQYGTKTSWTSEPNFKEVQNRLSFYASFKPKEYNLGQTSGKKSGCTSYLKGLCGQVLDYRNREGDISVFTISLLSLFAIMLTVVLHYPLQSAGRGV